MYGYLDHSVKPQKLHSCRLPVALLTCTLVLSFVFGACAAPANPTEESESSSTANIIQTELAPEIPDVCKIESYEWEHSMLNLQIRNLSKTKTLIAYGVLVRYADQDGKPVGIDMVSSTGDYGSLTAPGEVSPKVPLMLPPSYQYKTQIFITDVYYSDSSTWLNEELILSEQLQVALTVPQEVEGVYKIEQAFMDKLKLGLQIKNLSSTKTIQSYKLIVRYIDTSGKIWPLGQPFNYEGTAILPSGESERAYWLIPAAEEQAELFVEKIIYTDGTQWVNPDIPPEN